MMRVKMGEAIELYNKKATYVRPKPTCQWNPVGRCHPVGLAYRAALALRVVLGAERWRSLERPMLARSHWRHRPTRFPTLPMAHRDAHPALCRLPLLFLLPFRKPSQRRT